jgi:hypothetical protein
MDRLRVAVLLPFASLAVGCPSARREPPPPAERFAIASAAPGALGALAGGTKAAPQALTPSGTPTTNDEDNPLLPGDDDDEVAPDAGAKSPENLPL